MLESWLGLSYSSQIVCVHMYLCEFDETDMFMLWVLANNKSMHGVRCRRAPRDTSSCTLTPQKCVLTSASFINHTPLCMHIKVFVSYKKNLCVYMSFNIKRHIYTSVISSWHPCTYAYTCKGIHTCKYIYMHTYTSTHIYMHIYTYIYSAYAHPVASVKQMCTLMLTTSV